MTYTDYSQQTSSLQKKKAIAQDYNETAARINLQRTARGLSTVAITAAAKSQKATRAQIVALRDATDQLVKYGAAVQYPWNEALTAHVSKIKAEHLQEIRQVVDDASNNARCVTGCTNVCGRGCTGKCSTDCDNTCGTGCGTGSCVGTCGRGCSTASTCSSCGSSCDSGCEGCDSSCSDSCDGCTGYCEGTCQGDCTGSCTGECKGTCTGCTGSCWSVCASYST